MDFTVNTYQKLLDSLINAGYNFQTFTEFLEKPEERTILLRHDVDDKKLNSLQFAKIQHKRGIKGTYYFRMVPQSYDEYVIKEIADLGHEIGYHYEDMDFASSKLDSSKFGVLPKGRLRRKLKEEDLYDTAIEIFKENLSTLRQLYPVKTICMHGSPRSPFDNKALWKKYNYKDFDIIGEPYFDIDFNEVFYLTDTGRMWDGEKVSIRDKVQRSELGNEQTLHSASHSPFPGFHSTKQIIAVANNNKLPDKIMFTFHPQRWNDAFIPWMKELVLQNIKNQVKRYYVKKN